jgi:NADH-quinone oxidoreductase subunit E
MDIERIDQIIDRHNSEPGNLIKILLDVQDENKWLPPEVLGRVAARLKLPMAKVQHVATFYKSFGIMPSPEHSVHVCNGTSCHMRGSQRIVDAVRDLAGSEGVPGEFQVESVTCLGYCGSGPNLEIDGAPHISVTPDRAADLIKKLS